jgi:hypothetical protein
MFIDKGKTFAPDAEAERGVRQSRVLMNAELVGAAGRSSVRIRDLSLTGAHVTCDVPLAVHTDILFCKKQACVPARIAWVRGKSAGVTFYRELSDSEGDLMFGARERLRALPAYLAAGDEAGDA